MTIHAFAGLCHLLFVGAVHEISPICTWLVVLLMLNVVLAVPFGGQPGAFEKQGLLQAVHGTAD